MPCPKYIVKSEQLGRSFAPSPTQVLKTAGIEPPKPAIPQSKPGSATLPAAARHAAPAQPKSPPPSTRAGPTPPEHLSQPEPAPAAIQQPPAARQMEPHQPALHPSAADQRSPKARPSDHPTPKRSARSKPSDPSNPNHPPSPQPPPRRHAAHSGSKEGMRRSYRSSSIQHHATWLDKSQNANVHAV